MGDPVLLQTTFINMKKSVLKNSEKNLRTS